MYTIGEISKIVNISANALRYYDEIGLIKPILIQNNNQYRYYSDIQIKDILLVLELKQYGFTLEEVKELLQNKNNMKYKLMLEEKHAKLYNEIARLKDSSILLEKRISEMSKEDDMKMKGGKILIVDDLALVRIMIKNIIEEYGYTVAGEATNGEQAIIAYEQLKPDLVIMNITMPVLDGIDAATKITEKHKDARIIICSAMSYAPLVLESIKAGARDFVSKPLSSLRLINAVARGFDDNDNFDVERIEYISTMITKKWKDTSFNRPLKQEEIDTLIYKIIKEKEEDKFIYNFFSKINCDGTTVNEHAMSGPAIVDEKIIIHLKDKFTEISKELSSSLAFRFNTDCVINLLTVENITMGEFQKLMSKGNSTGVIKYKAPYSQIYIHLYGKIKNEQEILKEILDFIAKNDNLILPNYNTVDMLLSSDHSKIFDEDYSTLLISFDIEFTKGYKGFVAISIPHVFLEDLVG